MMEWRNAKQINEFGWMDCEINHPDLGWIPYTIDPNDRDMSVDNVQLIKSIGKNFEAYVPPPPPTPEELLAQKAYDIRAERDRRLREEVDPLVMNSLRWADFTPEQQSKIAAHRRALLDVTDQAGFPDAVEWPNLIL
jgi:hypothetical protein